jgi:hypothetical protein
MGSLPCSRDGRQIRHVSLARGSATMRDCFPMWLQLFAIATQEISVELKIPCKLQVTEISSMRALNCCILGQQCLLVPLHKS